MDIALFLSCFYAGCTSGYLSIWTRQDKQTSYFDTSSFPAAVAYAHDRAKAGYDVYFGTGLRRQPLGSDARGGKADVQWLTAMWIDIDIRGPGHKEAKLPETLEQAISVAELCPLEPSLIVDSGGGLHVYWLLSKPLEVPAGGHEKLNVVFKAFQKRIIAAAQARLGFKIDSTANIDRVLRLPETWNYKSQPRRPVEIIFDNDNRYDFKELVQSTRVLEVRKVDASASSVPSDFVEDIKRRLRNLANQENRDLMTAVLKGEPFAPGERDTLLQRAASCVAFVVPDGLVKTLDAKMLMPIFEASLEAMEQAADDPGNPPPTIENAIDKLSRALDDKARKIEANKELLAKFTREAKAKVGEPGGEKNGTNGNGNGVSHKPVIHYTPEQIVQFAKDQGVEPEFFKLRWIIQHDSSYYVFVNGVYKSPVGRESLLTHLRDDLAPAESVGVDLWTWSTKGNLRQKNMPELLRDYATGARHLKGSLCLDRSFFDAASETFWEAVCSVRDIKPVYHQQIDHWLHLLGGDQSGKLLDWIATALRLDLQSSALYVSGEAGAGKTMLAHGLSRLWSTSGPTLLENVADTNFNADIARCPLIFGDEQVKCSTSELRRLVGSSAHTLKRKYLANVDLDGALRIILADNSGKLIQSDGLGGADMGAVASKFLHITVTKKPAEYLRSIGGRAGTDGWVDQDKIAEHAMWIAFNREVTLGNRLAVEGALDRMARLLVVQDRVTGVLCEWISSYIADPLLSVSQFNGARIGGGKILVSSEVIARFWTSYIKSERNVFSMTKIGRALSNISESKEFVSFDSGGKTIKRRLHSVRPELIYEWAEENLSCDMDEFRGRVNKS